MSLWRFFTLRLRFRPLGRGRMFTFHTYFSSIVVGFVFALICLLANLIEMLTSTLDRGMLGPSCLQLRWFVNAADPSGDYISFALTLGRKNFYPRLGKSSACPIRHLLYVPCNPAFLQLLSEDYIIDSIVEPVYNRSLYNGIHNVSR